MKEETCMQVITVYGPHACTHLCVYGPIPNISVKVSYIHTQRIFRLCSLLHVTIPYKVKAFQRYAAPLGPSSRCKLRQGILRGFLCGCQVKNWPACQIIISENERLKRILSVVPSGLADKAHPLFPASWIRYRTSKYYFLALCMGYANTCCCILSTWVTFEGLHCFEARRELFRNIPWEGLFKTLGRQCESERT